MTHPWIVVGDFNFVLNLEDRIGGTHVTMAEISEFHKCIEKCGLLEFPTTGSRYTWNDRHEDSRIMSRIDWAFINSAWLNNMTSFRAQFLPENISDHCPLKLTPYSAQRKNKPAFKFYNVWSSHSDFMEVKFKSFSRRHFSDIVARADEDRLALAKIQAELHRNPLDTRIQQEEKVLFQRFKRSSYLAMVYLQQRNQQEIADVFVEYYQELLGTKGSNRIAAFLSFMKNGHTLTTSQQLKLVRLYIVAEVKKAMFSIEETKSPDPDEYDKFNKYCTDSKGGKSSASQSCYDLMLFCKGNINSIHRMMEAINHFSVVLGIVTNLDKSHIFLAGIEEDLKRIASHQCCAFSVYNFWGAIFILSQSVSKEIDRKCRDYLWNSTEEHIKIFLVAWEKVCQPKKVGDIKGCKQWNAASIECQWITNLRADLVTWSGIDIPTKNVSETLQWIRGRYWRQFRKEVAAAILVRLRRNYMLGSAYEQAQGRQEIVKCYCQKKEEAVFMLLERNYKLYLEAKDEN
ncbi:uncharacterized protein [Nicotiana tomentosiformis]|uniref:uncharacterized protein n=1 Tax=Nicotiana tomentosiformis TaxID=4098 RepID=UPI00388CA06A